MLTARQRELVEFIDHATTMSGGVCPSYSEMQVALGYSPKSKGSIHRLLHACEERGAVKILSKCARGVEVIRLKPRVKWFAFDVDEKILKPFET